MWLLPAEKSLVSIAFCSRRARSLFALPFQAPSRKDMPRANRIATAGDCWCATSACAATAPAMAITAPTERSTLRQPSCGGRLAPLSDASALTRYGIPTVNYGTSTGLMDVELGENLDIDGLVKTAEIYARVAQRVCA